jgi:RNA polymerase sigma factor (sigma-70 family)
VATDRPPERPAPTDVTAIIDLSVTLREALYRLAPKYRAVLVLRYLEDLSDDEIAEVLGCRPSTVRSQAVRAIDRLRTLCPELTMLDAEEVAP